MKTLALIAWLFLTEPASTPGIDPVLKDEIQIIQWSVAIVGALTAALVGIYQLRMSTKQRDSELRWKKASLAREILDEMWTDSSCSSAILMLEWKEREYCIKRGDGDQMIVICYPDVLSALQNPREVLDNKRRFVRDCFVSFFKMAEVLGHYVRIGLIDLDDLRYPYRFYVARMDKDGGVYYDFLKYYNFKNALRLFAQVRQMKTLSERSPSATNPKPAGEGTTL